MNEIKGNICLIEKNIQNSELKRSIKDNSNEIRTKVEYIERKLYSMNGMVSEKNIINIMEKYSEKINVLENSKSNDYRKLNDKIYLMDNLIEDLTKKNNEISRENLNLTREVKTLKEYYEIKTQEVETASLTKIKIIQDNLSRMNDDIKSENTEVTRQLKITNKKITESEGALTLKFSSIQEELSKIHREFMKFKMN